MKTAYTVFLLSLFITHESMACDLTINSTQNIQSSLNSIGINKKLCLEQGVYYPTATINMLAGQTLQGLAQG
ncbi:MAG: hypothetical protein L3J83_11535 [Proteobacteria bacterium]|nr:hypothetical protein [Pseudomonadota bacterium]